MVTIKVVAPDKSARALLTYYLPVISKYCQTLTLGCERHNDMTKVLSLHSVQRRD